MIDQPATEPAVLADALDAFGLPGKIIDVERMGRAWSNRVFRVRTTAADYAIKQLLNPWHEPAWMDWLQEAAAFELLAVDAGIAMPRPITTDTGAIFVEIGAVDSDRPAVVRAHCWTSGEPCPDGPVTPRIASRLGAELARMHALHHIPTRTDVFPTVSGDNVDHWDDLIVRLADRSPDLAAQASAATPWVRRIGRLLEITDTDFTGMPMSHGDVDQKNLILTSDGPVLCDWDVAAPWSPRQELARTAVSLATWQEPATARAVIDGYRMAGGEAYEIGPSDFGVDLAVGLDWLALSLERAAGLRDDGDQRRREAADALPRMLDELGDRLDLVERISRWLAG